MLIKCKVILGIVADDTANLIVCNETYLNPALYPGSTKKVKANFLASDCKVADNQLILALDSLYDTTSDSFSFGNGQITLLGKIKPKVSDKKYKLTEFRPSMLTDDTPPYMIPPISA